MIFNKIGEKQSVSAAEDGSPERMVSDNGPICASSICHSFESAICVNVRIVGSMYSICPGIVQGRFPCPNTKAVLDD